MDDEHEVCVKVDNESTCFIHYTPKGLDSFKASQALTAAREFACGICPMAKGRCYGHGIVATNEFHDEAKSLII